MKPHVRRASERPAPAARVRAMRSDALRNRERVLEAADAVFTERGPSASTDEVARRAEVSIGTVFRHFPTKEALLEAVVVGRLKRLVAEAERLACAPDPGAAFVAFFHRWIALSATKHVFADALARSGVDMGAVGRSYPDVVQVLHQAVEVLLVRAQRAGAVRSDVTTPTLVALMVGAARAAGHAAASPDRQAEVVSIILDGLRRGQGPAGPS